MKSTYKKELKELRDKLDTLNQERTEFVKSNNNAERIRRDVRIDEAKSRILEITGRTNLYNTPPKSANGYDSNLPPGLANDPADVPESRTCPHCKGDRVSPVFDGEVCETCKGEGEILPEVYEAYKDEVKYDQQANEA